MDLQPSPVFMVREGEFSLGGDRRSLLTVFPYGVVFQPTNQQYDDLEYFQPMNSFGGALLAVEASLLADAIQLQYSLMLKASRWDSKYYVNPRFAFNGLRLLKVNIGNGPILKRWWKDDLGNLWRIVDKPGEQPKDESIQEGDHPPLFYYHPTANNPLAQWTAISSIHPLTPRPGVMLLQDDTCLACTRDQALHLFATSPNLPRIAMILSSTYNQP